MFTHLPGSRTRTSSSAAAVADCTDFKLSSSIHTIHRSTLDTPSHHHHTHHHSSRTAATTTSTNANASGSGSAPQQLDYFTLFPKNKKAVVPSIVPEADESDESGSSPGDEGEGDASDSDGEVDFDYTEREMDGTCSFLIIRHFFVSFVRL